MPIRVPSPNFNSRLLSAVDLIVLHFTETDTTSRALDILTDGDHDHPVSAHYLIDRDGLLYQLVDEDKRAWHAGLSYWAGETENNSRSIGIELVNDGRQDYPNAQMRMLIGLCRDLKSRHPIPPWGVVGHSDIASSRKIDPGTHFDWARLAGAGIGIWPRVAPADRAPGTLVELQTLLLKIGYCAPVTGRLDVMTRYAIRAFQLHYRRRLVTSAPDAGTLAKARALWRFKSQLAATMPAPQPPSPDAPMP
ncbi:MAG: N-acetylmuramoyl-L-alanine amidase [Pseudomonadota bacterium]|nr:N-acetylmuramoyl-L-alanine amidase [Pseudomonadota bacterium]